MDKILEEYVNEVRVFEKSLISKADFEAMASVDRIIYVERFLIDVINKASTDSYETIICITNLVTNYSGYIAQILDSFLANYLVAKNTKPKISKQELDEGFLSFYGLAIYYYRKKEIGKLHAHIERFYDDFYKGYPLFYETLVRYFKISGDFQNHMLLNDKIITETNDKYPDGIIHLPNGKYLSTENAGLKAGYATAVIDSLELYCLGNEVDTYEGNVDSVITDEYCKKVFEEDKNSTVALNKAIVKKAAKYVDDCINFRPDYLRYYLTKAKFLFYVVMFNKEELTTKKIEEIEEIIDYALEKSNHAASNIGLDEEFEEFKEFIRTFPLDYKKFTGSARQNLLREKKKMERSLDIEHCDMPPLNDKDQGEFAFISYSSRDYKKVYCDLLEMQHAGISYFYDNKLTGQKHREGAEQDKWFEIIEEKIRECSLVICFVSESFISSPQIMRELQYMQMYSKPIIFVDLSGQKIISNVIKHYLAEDNNHNISQKDLLTLTSCFSDEVPSIKRGAAVGYSQHIPILYKTIINIKPNVVTSLAFDSITKEGECHKNEDNMIVDVDDKIFVVTDGVTRNQAEYDQDIHHSSVVSGLFAKEARLYIEKELKTIDNTSDTSVILKIIKAGAMYADGKVKEYNDAHRQEIVGIEEPGCCFIIGVIHNNKLYYAGAGDCTVLLVRDQEVVTLFNEQTYYVFKVLGLELDRQLLVDKYINNSETEFTYGLANGSLCEELITSTSIDLNYGDYVFFTSDGAAPYLKYTNPQKYINKSLEDIVSESDKLDKETNKLIDDKTIIRIHIGGIID